MAESNSNQIDISLSLLGQQSGTAMNDFVKQLATLNAHFDAMSKSFHAREAASAQSSFAETFSTAGGEAARHVSQREADAARLRASYTHSDSSSGQAAADAEVHRTTTSDAIRDRDTRVRLGHPSTHDHIVQGFFNTAVHRAVGHSPILSTVAGLTLGHPAVGETLRSAGQGPEALGSVLANRRPQPGLGGYGRTALPDDFGPLSIPGGGFVPPATDEDWGDPTPAQGLSMVGRLLNHLAAVPVAGAYLGSPEARAATGQLWQQIPARAKVGLGVAAGTAAANFALRPLQGWQQRGSQDLGYARSGSADLTIPGTGIGFEVPFLGQLIQPGTWQHLSDVAHEKLIAMQAGISGKQAKGIMENVESRGFIDNSDAKSRQLEGMVDIAKQVPGLDTGLTGTMMDESTRYGAESVGNFVAQMKRLPDAAHAANISLQTMHAQLQDFAGQMGQYGFTTAQSVSMGITGTQAFGTPLPVWSKLMSHPMTTGTMMGQTGLLPSQFGLAGPQAMQGAALQGFSNMVNMFHLSDRNVKDQFGVSHFISGKDAAINQAAQMYGLTPDQARAMYNHATTSKTFLGMSDWADTYAGNIAQQQKEGHMGQARAMLASSGSQIQKLLSDPNSGIAKGSSEYNEIEKALKQKGDPYTVAAARQKAINDAMNKQDKSWNNQQVQGQTVHVGFTGLAEKVLKQIIQPGGGFNSNPAHDIAKVGIDLADPVSGAADAFDAGKKILGSIGL